jgi:hypothetical protein
MASGAQTLSIKEMNTQQPPNAIPSSRRHLENEPWCFECDGSLQALRIMAEQRTKRVLVLNSDRLLVGSFELWNGRIVFRPTEGDPKVLVNNRPRAS